MTVTSARAPAAWRGRPIEAVLFDLDGTLLDTAADIAAALNRSWREHGWPAIADSAVRGMIGRGGPILLERAAASQGHTLDPAAHAALLERFFHHYGALQESNEFEALPYPGAVEALRTLSAAGVHIAIVTNKQERFARGLLDRLMLSPSIERVVGGDSCERRKPDPLPLLFACEELKVPASRAIMVGDSINDVAAARAAAIPIICVSYGYNEGNDPRELHCDALIDTLGDLPGLLSLPSLRRVVQ